jgi:TolA-binding protein
LYEAGRLQLQTLGKPEEALKTFQRILREYPRGLLRQEVFYHMAECYLAQKDYSKAIESFQEYLRRYPDGTRVKEASTLIQALHEKGWN